jgi:hypothetical protein
MRDPAGRTRESHHALSLLRVEIHRFRLEVGRQLLEDLVDFPAPNDIIDGIGREVEPDHHTHDVSLLVSASLYLARVKNAN